ncbi:EamA family transporter [Legionella sp. PATHC035]|uniref:EamA family transporter n=1 Tax=Legionella sp. PATHC035 TaxID=2992040 RepID=UPI0022438282|nr:EamA family transporter [Legionella sp. PATHC035]MCW8409214.1 EamA family transporter [Legionella sp. PATHC035]
MNAFLLWVSLIISDTVTQLLIKKGALVAVAQDHYVNGYIVAGYATLVISFFIWMSILKTMPLYLALSVSSFVYILIALSSYFILGETLTVKIFIGTLLIGVGVYIISYNYYASK